MSAPPECSSASLKIHFHGASVTAQTGNQGYFNRLKSKDSRFVGLASPIYTRTAYGASHFDIAGFHFIRDIEEFRPDYCVLEWTTTSAQSFSAEKCDAVSAYLTANGVVPIWLILPRLDDPDGSRRIVLDARNAAARWRAPIVDLIAEMQSTQSLHKLLRDVVHTNEEGADVYANAIAHRVSEISNEFNRKDYLISLAVDPDRTSSVPKSYRSPDLAAEWSLISNTTSHLLNHVGGDLEIVIEGIIGPHSPIVNMDILDVNGRIAASQQSCLFDPWCYYERRMTTPLLKARLAAGVYSMQLTVLPEDPTSRVVLRQPLKAEWTAVREVRIERLSLLNATLSR